MPLLQRTAFNYVPNTPTLDLTTGFTETANIQAVAATGVINYDINQQVVLYYTSSAIANWTLNIRGDQYTKLDSEMIVGQCITATHLVTTGATAYYNNVLQIDGVTVTPKWQGGTAPAAGNASSIDVYTYAIFKTGNATFTVLASQVQFK